MPDERDKYLGKDPYVYSQERDRFHKELFQFHHNRGTPFLSLPTVSGKQVDLYLLYSHVIQYGGFHKLCDRFLWYKIPGELFHYPESCANTELALKQIYMRYLYQYERLHLHGEDPDQQDDDEGPRSHKSSGRILVHQVPMRYNYRQHRVNRESRAYNNLSLNLCKPNQYERLEKSLLAGLPNEVDFALNVCCILSMEGQESLRLLSHRNLMELLLAHAGLFAEQSSLLPLYETHWSPANNRNFVKFWYDTIPQSEYEYGSALLDLISTQDSAQKYAGSSRLGEEVLHLGRDTINKDTVYQRVIQIATVLRNLSFDGPNAQAMSESELMLRFALLCSHSEMPQLKHTGLDLLCNIATKHVMPTTKESVSHLLLTCMQSWLQSRDKLELVNALLVLAGLAQVDQNEEVLVESLMETTYKQIVSLARIYDLQLIISALDALYFLSEMGEATCDSISKVNHCIDFLVNLLTVETQAFGESALGGIKVIDDTLKQPPPQQRQMLMGPPAAPGMLPRPPTPGVLRRPPTPQDVNRMSPRAGPRPGYPALQPRPEQPLLPATPQNLATMNPEQVACNWLRANYEQYPGALVSTAKVHQEYSMWLHRRGGQNAMAVTPSAFVACVRRVFPYSEIVANGQDSQIQGMRWKPPPQVQMPPHSGAPLHPGVPSHPGVPPHLHRPMPGQMGPSTVPPPMTSDQPTGAPGSLPPPPPYDSNSMSPRIVSPMPSASPSNSGNSEMLRHMLTNKPPARQRSNSSTSSKKGRSSPRSKSPPSAELQVCGRAEKADDIISSALTRIEKLENPRSPGVAPHPKCPRTVHATNLPNGEETQPEAPPKTVNGPDKTLDNGVGLESPSPSASLSSPPMCNGNHSDNDSLLAETREAPKRPLNGIGGGDADEPVAKKPEPKNGLVNGLEKFVDRLDGKTTTKPTDHQRHLSGGSLGSQSSTSTQLSQKAAENGHLPNGMPEDKSAPSEGSVTKDPSAEDINGVDTPVKSMDNRPASAGIPRRLSVSSTDSKLSSNTTDASKLIHRCCWGACTCTYATPALLRKHVSDSHTQQSGGCLWAGCDKLERKRWSLVSHVNERHTNDAALARSLANREKGLPAQGVNPTPPAIYAHQADQLAILRTAPKPPYQDMMDQREGPVTKHIRFTSALILRNISRYSSIGRMLLKRHEAHIAYIAGSTMEANGAMVNTLWEIQQQHT